jgi:hypothetical protein
MVKLQYGRLIQPTSLAAAAILSALIVQWSSTRPAELYSELLAWLLVPALFRGVGVALPSPAVETAVPVSRCDHWVLATGVAAFAFCRAENNVGGSLVRVFNILPSGLWDLG